jgi:hypothetical protein
MRTTLVILAIAGLLVVGLVILPAAALAGKPADPGHGNGHANGGPVAAGTTTSSTVSSGTTAAGKIAICHRTGSSTNPWVAISVSSNAWKAHAAHGDFRVSVSHPCPPATTTSTSTTASSATVTSSAASVTTVTVTQPVTTVTTVTVPVTTTVTQTITTTTTATP